MNAPSWSLVGLVGLVLLAGCRDRSPSGPDPRVRTLAVVLDTGVRAVPATPAGEYPAGSVVGYRFEPETGYGEVYVVLDSVAVPAVGTVTMDTDHVLWASADLQPDAIAADDPVRSAAERVLRAADPAAAVRGYLRTAERLEARLGTDAARRRLEEVEALVFDWAVAADAMLRTSRALHGEVFAVGPESAPRSGETAVASRSSAVLPRAATAAAAGSAASAQAAAATDPVRTVVIHTNGILNSLSDLRAAAAEAAGVARAAGLAVGRPHGDGGPVLDPARAPRLAFLFHYNHSLGLWGRGKHHCELKLLAELERRSLAYAATLPIRDRRELERRLGCSFRHDVVETIAQMVNVLLDFPAPAAGDASRLAELGGRWREAGYNVVFSAHSQGNLMTLEALHALRTPGDEPSSCAGFIAVAPPLLARAGRASRVDGIVVGDGQAIDFVARLPGPKPRPTSTRYARELGRSLVWAGALPDPLPQLAGLVVGLKLHGLTGSYLREGDEARAWYGDRLADHYRHLAARCTGTITGRVIDGATGRPVARARISAALDGAAALGSTGENGRFRLEAMEARPQTLAVSARGYLPVRLHAVEPKRFRVLALADVPLARAGGRPGGLAGVVRNARDNRPVPHAELVLREGINVRSGRPAAGATADSSGGYRFDRVAAGTYTLAAGARGFVTDTRTAVVLADTVARGQDLALSPTDGALRIKLTWQGSPADLDAHLTGPDGRGGATRFHVFWEQRGAADSTPFAVLDLDDRDGHGPETLTLTRLRQGVYRFSVHDYSSFDRPVSTALARSGARVQVYRDDRLWHDFAVPQGAGTVWTVFELTGDRIRRVDRIHTEPSFAGIPSASPAALRQKAAGHKKSPAPR